MPHHSVAACLVAQGWGAAASEETSASAGSPLESAELSIRGGDHGEGTECLLAQPLRVSILVVSASAASFSICASHHESVHASPRPGRESLKTRPQTDNRQRSWQVSLGSPLRYISSLAPCVWLLFSNSRQLFPVTPCLNSAGRRISTAKCERGDDEHPSSVPCRPRPQDGRCHMRECV